MDIKKPCSYPNCNTLVPVDGSARCEKHQYNRSSTTKYSQFYKSKAWQNLRKIKRNMNPLCEECESHGVLKPMAVVDHVIEIRDDFSKRLDIENLCSLCHQCHNIKTLQEAKKRKQKNANKSISDFFK